MRRLFFDMTLSTKLALVPALIAGSISVFGQGGDDKTKTQDKKWEQTGALTDVEIVITSERENTVPAANRNFSKIAPRASEPIKPPITYDFKAFNFQTPPINPQIRPLKLKPAEPTRVYNNYVSIGYGNYATPYIDAFVSNGRNKSKIYGAHAFYNNSIKGPVDGRNSGSGTYGLSVYGQSLSPTFSVSGNAGFENRSTHFYGYVPGTDVKPGDINQSINLFKMGLSVANAKNADFSFKLGGKFSYLGDTYSARESEVDFDFNSYYRIDNESRIRLNAGYALISRKDALVEVTPRSLFTANAAYEFNYQNDFKISAGAVVAYENDTLDNKNFHLYPDLKMTYKISPSVDAIASMTGGIDKVSLQTLTNENLWVAPNVPLNHTNKQIDLLGGINARLGNKFTANTGISIASLKDWYYYKNDSLDQSKFDVKYNTGSVQRSNFFVALNYAQTQAKLSMRGDVYGYSSDRILHRPTYRVTVDGSYNIYQKIILKANIIAQGGMKAYNYTTKQNITIKPAFDLNLRAEYLFSESLSAFVQLNNITSNKYQVFYNYPVRGFQVLAGITWSF